MQNTNPIQTAEQKRSRIERWGKKGQEWGDTLRPLTAGIFGGVIAVGFEHQNRAMVTGDLRIDWPEEHRIFQYATYAGMAFFGGIFAMAGGVASPLIGKTLGESAARIADYIFPEAEEPAVPLSAARPR